MKKGTQYNKFKKNLISNISPLPNEIDCIIACDTSSPQFLEQVYNPTLTSLC